MLLKGGSSESMTFFSGSDILDREDFEFTEGDVVRSNVNGIPTINFSERIRHLLAFPSVVLAWIRFPRLSGFLYKRRVLKDIGSSVGKVAQLDLKIDNKTRDANYLDSKRHSVVLFKENYYSNLIFKGHGSEGKSGRGIVGVSLNRTIWEKGGHFKNTITSRIPLLEAMSSMANLINSQVELGADVDIRNTEGQIGGVDTPLVH
ncbi:hypothetical protein PVK06_020673 [Gossypium arboreum]|uniref:Uncharacterized protein n=1 Tax=Gossypium arboreum TaxID=29729 RepID=A0ABR0PMZ7_GOSAR|nr:hypothetical protein PVK06_020673 [Gossypium arboreum]